MECYVIGIGNMDHEKRFSGSGYVEGWSESAERNSGQMKRNEEFYKCQKKINL